MKVSVFGAGYVGLVTAVCLAEIGHSVICIDNDQAKIDLLNQGICPIYESELQPLLDKHLSKQLFFSTDASRAIVDTDLLMIAVGTPLNKADDVNLDYVYQVATTIAYQLNYPCSVILKSTTPPGTANALTQYVNGILKQRNCNFSVDVATNPEFLQEGTAVQQFMYPDRIIIGAEDIKTIQLMHDLYRPITKDKNQLLIMDKASAELTKYASNALLATKVSFMNEISQIAEAVGANINSVKMGVGQDYRINPLFLNAGCGFGGSCFPKDIMTLIAMAKQHQIEPYVMESVIKRNLSQQKLLFHKVSAYFQRQLKGKTIALWGLTFKPNTDDIRCSTSQVLIDLFLKAGSIVRAFDPMGMDNFAKHYDDQLRLQLCSSPLDALDKADVLVITTEWHQFKKIPLAEIKQRLHYNAIFDGRNIFNYEETKRHQLNYFGIGMGDNLHAYHEELMPTS